MSKEQELPKTTETPETPETPGTIKIRVLTPTHDKTNPSVEFAVGDELELETERAEAAIAAGLAERVTPGI